MWTGWISVAKKAASLVEKMVESMALKMVVTKDRMSAVMMVEKLGDPMVGWRVAVLVEQMVGWMADLKVDWMVVLMVAWMVVWSAVSMAAR